MRSRTKFAIGLVSVGAVLALARSRGKHPIGNPSVPEPARAVSTQRYLGRWYEIARYDQRFERGSTNVTADYSLRGDGRIDVVNSCRAPDGTRRVTRGVAKTVSASMAKLKVRFFGPVSGDYWVLDHAEDYSWSIVGEPSGRCLWILARQSNPGTNMIQQLVGRATDMGYDTSMLVYTAQA